MPDGAESLPGRPPAKRKGPRMIERQREIRRRRHRRKKAQRARRREAIAAARKGAKKG